ncbi:MAG TPA: DUF1116 domain-containing protein, partial [Firmicutes bacterium]|nr:DUF1116 domain-containing protein [Bacillota bacterium]
DIEEANRTALERFAAAQPVLVDVSTAREAVPGMTEDTILHAGPPITWERMSGPVRGAVIGALLYEGKASTPEEAEELAASGRIVFSPCHEHAAVGPMAGVVSPSMPVFVVHNHAHGNRSYCTLNEGLGRALRFGAYGPEVIEKLRWMEKVLAPGIKRAVELAGGIDLRSLMAQAVHMGDEMHNRNKAANSLFLRRLTPHLLRSGLPSQQVEAIFAFIDGNDHFFLNLAMPAMKAMLDAAHNVPRSTMVTAMARNGTDFGIRVSGLGDHWFTGPAQHVKGLYFPGFGTEDANPDLGDSAIMETGGLGGFAMAAAIPIVQFVGGTHEDAQEYTRRMYEITLGEHPLFTIPGFGFRGVPAGIDLRQVVEKNTLPIINTGIAHRDAGVGQVGAGLVHPPWEAFQRALLACSQW